MVMLHLTDEAHRAIRAASDAPGGFKQTGTQRSDGSWDVPVGDDTLERIQSVAHPGETLSDTILRVCTLSGGKAN